MRRKTLLFIVLILLVLTSFLVFYFLIKKDGNTSKWISGTVTEVKGGELTVEGQIIPATGSKDAKNGVVRITVDQDTKIIKFTIIGDDSKPAGEAYDAATKIEEGNINDIKPGSSVRIFTKENIWNGKKGNAAEITYFLII